MAETKPKNRKSAERTKQVNVALTDREAAMLNGLVRVNRKRVRLLLPALRCSTA